MSDDHGVPQLGATVQLFDRFGRQIGHAYTAMDGRFAFPNLRVDLYSVRVSVADYLPVRRDSIPVQPGAASMLEVHVASLFSSIELNYTLPSSAMSKDWKWVLRSSTATRPITRMRPEDVSASGGETGSRVFTDTHAVVTVSGGGGPLIDADESPADFGTGFLLSTNILGKNKLVLNGAVAQNSTLSPAAMALSAVYNRTPALGTGYAPPEVTFNLSQIGVSSGPVGGMPQTAGPMVRTMSVSLYQVLDLAGAVRVEYGATAETVSYLTSTSRLSPFARATVPTRHGDFVLAYADGARPDELRAHADDEAEAVPSTLPGGTSTFSRLPQISYADGRLELQRTASYEAGYRKTSHKRTVAVSAFSENITNGRVDAAGNTSVLSPGDLMTDGISNIYVYNYGRLQRSGVVGSISQKVSDTASVSFAYGEMGGFDPQTPGWSGSGSIDNFLSTRMHNVASGAVNVRAPKSHTRICADYGWMDNKAVVPRHIFTTQDADISPGLNIAVQQPIPNLFGIPGHMVISADLRNLLGQGYMPVETGGRQNLLLVQTPRAVLGSVNFIF